MFVGANRLPRYVLRLCCLLLLALPFATSQTDHSVQVHKGQTKVYPQYEVIAPGLLGSPVALFQFKSASLRLEIRNLVMGNASAETAPMPTRTIFEVRGGTLVVTLNGEQRTYLPGDFFVVDKG